MLRPRNPALTAVVASAASTSAVTHVITKGRAALVISIAVAAIIMYSVALTGGGRGARTFAGATLGESDADPAQIDSSRVRDELLDSRRKLDLGELHDALEAYAGVFGKYPSTSGKLTTFCSMWTDAGCDVLTHGQGLPASDGFVPYWYASDGDSYTLMAYVRDAPVIDECPDAVRSQIMEVSALCVSGQLPRPERRAFMNRPVPPAEARSAGGQTVPG